MKNDRIEHYLKIIDEVERVRKRNNVNWMDVLRLAFRHAPNETRALVKKINHEDDQVSALFKQLAE